MAYIDAANYNKVRTMRGLPIGAILPWSGGPDTIPVGWIECSGTAVPYTRYPLLYNVIGNTYGGVQGSTFRTPPLNNSNVGIMDIFQGHFQYLQDKGDAHRPENANLADDEYWATVGQSDNGNQSNNVTVNHNTSVDVFGEQINNPQLVAKYQPFELSTGTVDTTINVLERKTTDVHLPSHSHNYETDGSPSYNRKSNKVAVKNSDNFGGDAFCYVDGDRTNVSRSVNDPPLNGTQMANVGASNTVGTGYRRGGGNPVNDGPNGDPQYAATGFDNGDGYSSGDMFSHIGGTKYFFTSLSNDQRNISNLTGHRHGTLDYSFESKVKVINPGIVNDVQINNVTIDNTPGNEFCRINMISATPNLGMLYIIRAF